MSIRIGTTFAHLLDLRVASSQVGLGNQCDESLLCYVCVSILYYKRPALGVYHEVSPIAVLPTWLFLCLLFFYVLFDFNACHNRGTEATPHVPIRVAQKVSSKPWLAYVAYARGVFSYTSAAGAEPQALAGWPVRECKHTFGWFGSTIGISKRSRARFTYKSVSFVRSDQLRPKPYFDTIEYYTYESCAGCTLSGLHIQYLKSVVR